MGMLASQITSLTIVYSTDYSGVDKRKHQSSASLAFVWGIHRGPVNSPQKWPVTRKMFPFDDVIMTINASNSALLISSRYTFAIFWYQVAHVCVSKLDNYLFRSLQWRHDERDGVWNHRRLDCLLNHLFRRRSQKTPKLRVTDLCEGNIPVTGEFPAQRASNAKNVSIWRRHQMTSYRLFGAK